MCKFAILLVTNVHVCTHCPESPNAHKHADVVLTVFFYNATTSLDNLNNRRIMPILEHLRNIVFINDKYSRKFS